jgi:uncharacterized membrane protein YoaK (UPF0700 family)
VCWVCGVGPPPPPPPHDEAGIRDALLVGLTLSTGCVDAISWLGLGKVFSAFMTGNLAFLGFRAAGAPGPSVPRVVIATALFGAGAALAARIVRRQPGPGTIWPRSVTIALSTALACQAAFLAFWLAVHGNPASNSGHALIAMSAFAMGMQTTAVFSLGVRADFTTAATATFAVLMGDLAGWKQARDEKRRLAGTLTGLLAGAFAGAVLVIHARSWAPAIPLVVTAAVVVTAVARLQGDRKPD